jgi:surface antigen
MTRCFTLVKENVLISLYARRPVKLVTGRDLRTKKVVGSLVVLALLLVALFGAGISTGIFGAFAQGSCSTKDQTHVVQWGDTLGAIAAGAHTSVQSLATHNGIANPNLIFVGQRICIPRSSTVPVSMQPVSVSMSGLSAIGASNLFPYGQCTWWANQRYFQLHGVFVPWTINSNAFQWTARAYDFRWHVSSTPSVGAIVDFQPGVQGASNLGHLGVVETILGNGRLVVSNMNWNGGVGVVSYVQFSPGPGVTFITR